MRTPIGFLRLTKQALSIKTLSAFHQTQPRVEAILPNKNPQSKKFRTDYTCFLRSPDLETALILWKRFSSRLAHQEDLKSPDPKGLIEKPHEISEA
jgi:hypothetical protein